MVACACQVTPEGPNQSAEPQLVQVLTKVPTLLSASCPVHLLYLLLRSGYYWRLMHAHRNTLFMTSILLTPRRTMGEMT